MEKIRVFIAIELPAEVKKALMRLQERLKAGQAPVRWADPDSIHLTLQFLGYVDAAITGDITAAMTEAVRGVGPFHLACGGLGVFPDPKRVRVMWVGLTGDLEKLNQLQKRVESSLSPLGFKPEARPFTAHLTLGRVRGQARPEERQKLGQLVAAAAAPDCLLDVNAVHLIRSQLRPQGPLYTIISSAELN